MPEILLYDENITVLGSPETVLVQTDFGPQGTRGSQIFASEGNPNIVGVGQTPLINDLCINIAEGEGYSDLYQYVSEPGGNTWLYLFTIQAESTGGGGGTTSTEYNAVTELYFSSGLSTLTIPLSSIMATIPPTIDKTNFRINLTAESPYSYSDVVSLSFYIQDFPPSPTNLVLTVQAVEFTGGYMVSLLSGSRRVHVSISTIGL